MHTAQAISQIYHLFASKHRAAEKSLKTEFINIPNVSFVGTGNIKTSYKASNLWIRWAAKAYAHCR